MPPALFAVLFIFLTTPLWPQTTSSSPAFVPPPVFVADLANPNDFSIFANGGWDGNWFVGYNNCWIQKLAVPEGKYRRAFVGAKLGRMKSFQPPGKAPWEKKADEGEIFMAVSSTPSWNKAQSVLVTAAEDIPLEPDFENAVEGVGESRWFWKEIPIESIGPGKDHFVLLWAGQEILSISSAPILASGWGNKDVNSWLRSLSEEELKQKRSWFMLRRSRKDSDVPPLGDAVKTLSTPVTVFEPAIALKLIPSCSSATASKPGDCPENPSVNILKIESGKPMGNQPAAKIVWAGVSGESVERAWLEISVNKKDWKKYGRILWSAPYVFTVKMNEITVGPDGKAWIRAAARDVFENTGTSEPANLMEVFRK